MFRALSFQQNEYGNENISVCLCQSAAFGYINAWYCEFVTEFSALKFCVGVVAGLVLLV